MTKWEGINPLVWFHLMRDLDAFTQRTGMGMARTWGFVHEGNYHEARASLDDCLLAEKSGDYGSVV